MATSTKTGTGAAARLYELEKQFDSLRKTMAVVEFDPDGHVLDANPIFLDRMGYSRDEVVGEHHRIFVSGEVAKTDAYELFWQELGAGADQAGEFARIAKDGSTVWIEGSYNALMDDSGKVFKVVAYVSEVTARKVREREVARIVSMMESAPINILCADTDGVIQYLNPKSVETLTSLQSVLPIPVDRILGTSVDVFLTDPARQRRVIADGSRLPIHSRIRLATETLELLVSAMYGADGVYLGPMVTWEVITDRIEQEADLFQGRTREREAAEELARKVDQMLLVVRAAADGDLTQQVSVQGEDAIGQMGEGLSRLLASLRESIRGIAENATTLASASEELTATSHLMSANSEETGAQAVVVAEASRSVAANVQTVASGTDELSASINEIAASATRAAGIAGDAVLVAEGTNRTVSKLGESSSEIGQVVKVITSIAQQTNLLALNATIEAARAGEAGKGFAVVANEVKELAKETARATEDISRKIEAIQGDTRESVSAIEKISRIIGQINDIQGTIASAVEEQTATTSEMARNVSDANGGTQEIVQNIGGVAQAAQETSRGASGVETAAADLAKMAGDLQQMVARFRF